MKIINILVCLLTLSLHCKDLEQIFQTKPWTAIIPFYGDLKLKKLNQYLVQQKEKIDLLKDLTIVPTNSIIELKNQPDAIRKDLWLINNLLTHITAHRKATLAYSCITIGSLLSIMCLHFAEDTYCTGNINECDYSIDKIIPLTLLCASAPFFFYKFLLEPDVASHEKEFAELIEKLRNY